MYSAASVPQHSGSSLGFLPILLVLLPVAILLARGVFSRPSQAGHPSGRYRLDTTRMVSGEFIFAVLFVALGAYLVLGRNALLPPVTLKPGHGHEPGIFGDIAPLLVVLIPFAGALISGLAGRRHGEIRDSVASATAFLTFAMTLSMYSLVAHGEINYTLPSFMGLGLFFRVDFTGFIFASVSSLIWFLATLYSAEYMRHEHAPTRYTIFLLMSLGGCVGVFVTGDFLSLFLFFEAMTLASYVLVIHAQSEEAMAAGRNYLYMGVFGGLCLLAAILLLITQAGTISIAPNLEAVAGLGSLRYLLALLFFIGFGIKAGAVPLHIWLPQAHPVAPTPASALLSGIMIKTGAYGIIRVFAYLFTPHDGHSALWKITEQFGFLLIWVGVITMFVAAVLALSQRHAKRVLAYSSVSQMGYILMGIGTAAYLGYEGAMGFAGLSYHILNHAFFKAGMFLMVGAIYLRTHDLNYDKLGGLWRRFPVTALAFLVAGAAISGIPGFNGYASKTLLHHAIVESWEHHHLASLWWAEKIFVVTGGLTFCYILRLFSSIFLGREKESKHPYAKETFLERLIFIVFAGVILYGGLAFSQVINRVVLPMTAGFAYDHHAVDHIAHISVWNSHDLSGIAVSIGIGAVIFLLLSRLGFRLPLPGKLSVEHLVYKPVLNGLIRLYMFVGRIAEGLAEGSLAGSVRPATQLARMAGNFDTGLLPRIGNSALRALTVGRDSFYSYLIENVEELRAYTRQAEWVTFLTMIKVDYNPRGDDLYKKLTLMNLDLCLFIVVVTLVLIFSMRFLTLLGP